MRIIYLGNNWLGLQVLRFLVTQEEEIVGLVLNTPGTRRYGIEITSSSNLPSERILSGDRVNSPETVEQIRALGPDIIISVLFDNILKSPIIDIPKEGVINLHPSFLPYNRGQHPNIWSIVEETPAGVTLHYIDQGVDTGDIIAQKEVPVDFTDTGGTLYRKLEKAALQLFIETWPSVRAGTNSRDPQIKEGTSHLARDIRSLDEINLDHSYTARHLLNILRARTFPPYDASYVRLTDGTKAQIHVSMTRPNERELQEPLSSEPLLGEKTRLRPINEDDLLLIARWRNRESILANLFSYEPISDIEQRNWWQGYLSGDSSVRFIFEDIVDAKPIGTLGVTNIDYRRQVGELTIILGETEYEGRGYAKDALRVLLKFAFSELNLHRIEANVLTFNERAIHLFEKVGFKMEGMRRDAYYTQKKHIDIAVMGILDFN